MPSPESSQSKMANCSSDLSYMPDEFVELLWDNGPVVQAQPNKARKSFIFTALNSSGSRFLEKDGKDNPYPKIGHFKAAEPKLNNLPSPGSSAGFEIHAQDDDIVPWINYAMEDPIHNDYCSELLNDYPAVDLNSIHSRTNTVPTTRGSYVQAVRDSDNGERGHASATSRIRANQLFQLPPQFDSSVKSSEKDLNNCNSSKAHKESGGIGIKNFSYFSRPVALARANLQGVDRSERNNKATFATASNPIDSLVAEPSSGLKSVVGTHVSPPSSVPPSGDLMSSPRPPQEVIVVDQSKAICEEDSSRKNIIHSTAITNCRSPERVQTSSFAASVAVGRHEIDKGNEAVVASSSVCSGSSAGPTSTDHKDREKRKCHEVEESGYQSEDLEGESMDLKKSGTSQSRNKKRSRAAEVHNLSERRRRDRINERMRALQELIPNCNKTDKASMLDEAIEYLKSLQMQVQMMSMGGGLCMSPMVIQHMRAPPSMAHFSPMGMGMGYGMGIYDMNGSPGCSFFPVLPIQRPQFSYPSIPGSAGLHRVPGPGSVPMFGVQGQGLPVPMPYRQPANPSADTKAGSVGALKPENQQHGKTEDSEIKE